MCFGVEKRKKGGIVFIFSNGRMMGRIREMRDVLENGIGRHEGLDKKKEKDLTYSMTSVNRRKGVKRKENN